MLFFFSAIDSVAAENKPAEELIVKGQIDFDQGRTADAIEKWEKAFHIFEKDGRTDGQIHAILHLAAGYQSLGHFLQAGDYLKTGMSLAEKTRNKSDQAWIMDGLGEYYQLIGEPDQALHYLKKASALSETLQDHLLTAAVMNSLGNYAVAVQDFEKAKQYYDQSIRSAYQCGDTAFAASARINLARVALEMKAYPKASAILKTALKETNGLPASRKKLEALIAIGVFSGRISGQSSNSNDILTAFNALKLAEKTAERQHDPRNESLALGYLGHLYELEKRYDASLDYTQRALFIAQKISAPEIQYQWEWQIGRILTARDDIDGAILSYQEAVYHLKSIREDLAFGCKISHLSFRETVGPVYFALADLLLRRSAASKNEAQRKADLLRARETVEYLKAAELQDYFQDACITSLKSKITDLDQIAADTATIYPIVFPDRIVLLVGFSDGIEQFSVPVDSITLSRKVNRLRRKLQYSGKLYLPYAQQLYVWLIKPFESELKTRSIKTLVFIPDGPLLTIPMSVLFDGKSFLIERYAIVTSPGLTLTDPHPLNREQIIVLLTGISTSVLGFSSLPSVTSELKEVSELYRCSILQDKAFTVSNFEKDLQQTPYTIVHIASHGNFNSDPQKTFILAYDGKITMDKLESLMESTRYRSEPVELLTLSACQTAVGDDRAALGLAGVALKAGVRSAIASLWFVNDEATSRLSMEFYKNLQTPRLSKAQALQQAQIRLLEDARFKHPAFWAPFLLIGNWL